MILYHGSSHRLTSLERRQAQQGEGMNVPEKELLNAIYLTPDYGFAIAMGSMPEGAANINDEKKTIEFENPYLFNPEKEVFVYEVDTSNIPTENLVEVDERQYAVINTDEIKPSSIQELKAREILKYYELTNWKEGDEEQNSEIKLR